MIKRLFCLLTMYSWHAYASDVVVHKSEVIAKNEVNKNEKPQHVDLGALILSSLILEESIFSGNKKSMIFSSKNHDCKIIINYQDEKLKAEDVDVTKVLVAFSKKIIEEGEFSDRILSHGLSEVRLDIMEHGSVLMRYALKDSKNQKIKDSKDEKVKDSKDEKKQNPNVFFFMDGFRLD